MPLHHLVAMTGGFVRQAGMAANIPAPGHGRHDRSVALRLGFDGKVLVTCFGDSTWKEVLRDLRALGLVDCRDRLVRTGSDHDGFRSAPVARQRFAQDVEERIEAARAIWAGARPIRRTLSEAYLQRRSIMRPVSNQAIQHNQDVPLSVYRPGCTRRPGMVCAFRSAGGEVTGVEITYLDHHGRRDDRLLVSRKTVGCVPLGSAARLDPAAEEMVVGEGVATTLSATERFRLPGWALGSVVNLRRWNPPEVVRRVVIAADANHVGRTAADQLAEHLKSLGVQAEIRIPPDGYGDWNDVANERATDPS